MIQDIFDPEVYLALFKATHPATNNTVSMLLYISVHVIVVPTTKLIKNCFGYVRSVKSSMIAKLLNFILLEVSPTLVRLSCYRPFTKIYGQKLKLKMLPYLLI